MIYNDTSWRKVTVEDYNNILVKWWSKHEGWEAPPLDVLPNGFIISKNGIDTYAGFLYYTGTKIAWLEFVISNPDATVVDKKGCLEELMNVISIIAKEKGVRSIFTSTNNPAFCNGLKKNGFIETDKNVTQLIKNI